jgi:RanBP-type and C3HC4-type zinc finger-containing protein 1
MLEFYQSTVETSEIKAIQELYQCDVNINVDPFVCECCFRNIEPGQGMTLRACQHAFCRECLIKHIEEIGDIDVCCPQALLAAATICNGVLEEQEIRALITTEQYDILQGLRTKTKRFDYDELLDIYNEDVVQNFEVFECPICFTEIDIGMGITLKNCLHEFCADCLKNLIIHCDEIEIKCPYRDEHSNCESILDEKEIKALIEPDILEKRQQKVLQIVEASIEDSYHCRTPNCAGWVILDNNVTTFECAVCRQINCIQCKAIHMGLTCLQYQDKLLGDLDRNEANKRTVEELGNMVSNGKAMNCPKCGVRKELLMFNSLSISNQFRAFRLLSKKSKVVPGFNAQYAKRNCAGRLKALDGA